MSMMRAIKSCVPTLLIGSALTVIAGSTPATQMPRWNVEFKVEHGSTRLRDDDRSYFLMRHAACHFRSYPRQEFSAFSGPLHGEQSVESLVRARGVVLKQAIGLWFPVSDKFVVEHFFEEPPQNDAADQGEGALGLFIQWMMEPLPDGQTSASCVPSLSKAVAALPLSNALELLSSWAEASPQRALASWVPLLIAETGRVDVLEAWRDRTGLAYSAHALAQMAGLAALHGHTNFLRRLVAEGVELNPAVWMSNAACRTQARLTLTDHQHQVAAVSLVLAEAGTRLRVEEILPALSCARLQDDLGAFKHLLDQLPSDQGDARLLPTTYEYSSFGMLAATLDRFPSLLNEGEEQRLRMGEALAATRLMSVEELDWLQQRGVRFDRGAMRSSSLLTSAWKHSPPTVLTQLHASGARLVSWTEFQVEGAVHNAWTPLNGNGLAWLLAQGLRPEAPSRLAMAMLDRGDDAAPALAEMKALGLLQWDASQRQVALRRCVLSLSAACARLWWDDAAPEELAEAIALAEEQRTDYRQQAYYGVPVRRVRTLPNQAMLKQSLLEALRDRARTLKTH